MRLIEPVAVAGLGLLYIFENWIGHPIMIDLAI
jgi:hypothetical protein